jgi:hypothetical protein
MTRLRQSSRRVSTGKTRKVRRAARREKRRRKTFLEARLVGPLTISDNDKRWKDLYLNNEECSERSSHDSFNER